MDSLGTAQNVPDLDIIIPRDPVHLLNLPHPRSSKHASNPGILFKEITSTRELLTEVSNP